MASTHRRPASGSQGGFALVLAIAAFTASLFLWADARADTALPQTPVSTDTPA
jgi:hypothetical protein